MKIFSWDGIDMPRIFQRVKAMNAKKSKDAKQDKALKRLTRVVKRIEPEVKYYTRLDGHSGAYQGDTNALQNLDFTGGITQGTDNAQRIGNKIQIRRIQFRAMAVMNSATVTNGNWMRFILYQMKIYNGSAALNSELLLTASTLDGKNQSACSVVNPAFCTQKLYGKNQPIRILYDKTIMFGSNVGGAGVVGFGGQTNHIVSYDKVYKVPLQVQYDSATAENGQVFLAVFPGNDTTAGSNVDWTLNATVFYTDA